MWKKLAGKRSDILSQILKRNEHTMDGSEELWNYAFDNYIKPNVNAGKIKKD